MSAHIDQAVILAAGKGTRIRGTDQVLPKPLVKVGGLSLLKRSILTAKKEGITRFVIVIGCDGDLVRAELGQDPELTGVELIWAQNPDYHLGNGVSVLKAAPHIDGEFFLMMADHVVDPAIYRTLQERPARGGLVLAVDRKLDSIFDMDDATKVKCGPDDTIAAIGKHLTDFDAVDTGVFRCDPALFDALQTYLDAHGDTSLSNGVQTLAAEDRAHVADIGSAWWQDVDTPETQVHASDLLFNSLTKSIDGPVSRHINRKFSKAVTRLVMNTNIIPNHMTFVGLVLGLAAAAVTAMTTASSLWLLAVGGVLYQLSSMIDGCDGELARLKFKHSETGEWFDTVADDVINLTYQVALGYALFQITGAQVWFQLSVATFVLGWLLCGALYRKLLSAGQGTHLALDFGLEEENPSAFTRFIARVEFIGRRDFYSLLIMFLTFFGPTAMQGVLIASFLTVALTGLQWTLNATSREEPARPRDRDTANARG